MAGIVLISDTHFENRSSFGRHITNPEYPGCNNRFHEIAQIFKVAVDYGVKNSCEALVILGDIFHSRGTISIPIYNAVYSLFKESAAKLPIIMYPGNHDFVDLRALHSDKNLHSLFTYEKTVQLYDKPALVELDNFNLGIVPFSPFKEDLLVNSAKLKNSIKRKNKVNILMLHHSVSGAISGPHEWRMPHELAIEEIPEFDQVFSGHLHAHQQIGKLWYVGAPLQHDFGERNYSPGFVHVLPSGAWKHIENKTSPRFVNLEAKEEKDLNILLDHNYNQIKWLGDSTEGEKIRKNRQNVLVEIKPQVLNTQTRTDIKTTESPEEMMKKYIQAKIGNFDKSLLDYGVELYK